MLNNLVNLDDVRALRRVLRSQKASSLLARISRNKDQQTRAVWARTSSSVRSWYNLPCVVSHWNQRITGDANKDWRHWVIDRHLQGRSSLVGLSLACGLGGKEIEWAKTGIFARLDGWDLSETRIDAARKAAKAEGVGDVLNFVAGDALKIAGDNRYDVVIADSALHHISPLRQMLKRIAELLRQDGLFIVNDFVGPTRFQWQARQMQAMTGLLHLIPSRYRYRISDGSFKDRVERPSIARMIWNDPSEAVESSEILPLLKELFCVADLRGYGGTLLHMVLHDIAGNFSCDTAEDVRLLDLLFAMERTLIDSNDLSDDFVLAVCTPRVPHQQLR